MEKEVQPQLVNMGHCYYMGNVLLSRQYTKKNQKQQQQTPLSLSNLKADKLLEYNPVTIGCSYWHISFWIANRSQLYVELSN